jgi:hypothetical protein
VTLGRLGLHTALGDDVPGTALRRGPAGDEGSDL